MQRQHEKWITCSICETDEIVLCYTEQVVTGDIPDQSNCDLSTYTNHRVEGGRLLKERYVDPYKRKDLHGICNTCLAMPHIKNLVDLGQIILE